MHYVQPDDHGRQTCHPWHPHPIDLLVRMVAQGIPQQEILADYPRLQAEDSQAALLYSLAVTSHVRAQATLAWLLWGSKPNHGRI